MTIYVVLPLHNRWHLTRQFLDSLRNQDLDPSIEVKVIAVDDASTDETAEELAKRSEIVLRGDGNLWWAGCVFQALEYLSSRIQTGDWVYLANNDTVLAPDHLSALVATSQNNPGAMIGSVSFEIWPDGTRHPVSSGFHIDAEHLVAVNLPYEPASVTQADALAARGLLLSHDAALAARLTPKSLPQHFADLAMTAELRAQGFTALVDPGAQSTQLERAGSSVQFAPRVHEMLRPKSQLYLPAVWSFWWRISTPRQRALLIPRFLRRGIRQVMSGSYAFGDRSR